MNNFSVSRKKARMEEVVTELSNSITSNIDIASSADIVKLLYEADKQMFCCDQGLLNNGVMMKLDLVVDTVVDYLQMAENDDGSVAIVLSGCGTSGRLAFMTARSFNALLSQFSQKQNVFEYLIAGHDDALFVSRELAEDDPLVGQTDLEAIAAGKKKVLYFGITCGLSAPYVAGQLDWCMNSINRCLPILIGFNPVKAARDLPIENWDKTFLRVANRLQKFEETRQGYIINPVIGAEPITGSTRMKSGSATKMILDTILTSACIRILHNQRLPVSRVLTAFQAVEHVAYSDVDTLSRIVDIAGSSLRSGGHIYYVSSCNHLALCGLVDASECQPTYGADLNDVRGFVSGGFETLGNRDGDVSHVVAISTQYFESQIVPHLTSSDTVVVIASDDAVYCSQSLIESTASKILLYFSSESSPSVQLPSPLKSSASIIYRVLLPEEVKALGPQSPASQASTMRFLELACKLTCNMITTGAFILRGKVYENFMIDVRVSNNKLYHRAVNIVQRFGQCDKTTAVGCLLRCIYDKDLPTDDEVTAPISQHIRHAAKRQKTVPLAVLLARLHCTLQEGRRIISDCPVLRIAIDQCQK